MTGVDRAPRSVLKLSLSNIVSDSCESLCDPLATGCVQNCERCPVIDGKRSGGCRGRGTRPCWSASCCGDHNCSGTCGLRGVLRLDPCCILGGPNSRLYATATGWDAVAIPARNQTLGAGALGLASSVAVS